MRDKGCVMGLPNLKVVDNSEPAARRSSQPAGSWLEFAGQLARKHAITGDLLAKFDPSGGAGARRLRDLWEVTDLSASDFADEVARFYDLPRVTLPQLMAASSLTAKFS